jgi:hydroxymethylbilane synthase
LKLAEKLMAERIRIATRGSKLALWQAEHIAELLRAREPGLEIELKVIKTSGDKIQDVPLAKVGGKGLFVKEIEEALMAEEADLAVHSMKDMPAEVVPGLTLGVIPARDDHTDCLLSTEYEGLESLPQGSVVGTSSLRRQAQLLGLRPDLRIEPLRGNLDTRLRKLEQGLFAAIIVASVGLKRLGLGARYQTPLGPPEFLPAVGQGALGIEYCLDNNRVDERLQFLNDESAWATVTAERAFLHELEGGCQVPIGGLARIENNGSLVLEGLVADVDGATVIRRSRTGRVENPDALGREVARDILESGGKAILDRVYSDH